MAYWNLLLWDPTELDEVQSLKKWEGLPFCNHHSLLIHDTHSARENSAHAVSSSRGGGVSLASLLNSQLACAELSQKPTCHASPGSHCMQQPEGS